MLYLTGEYAVTLPGIIKILGAILQLCWMGKALLGVVICEDGLLWQAGRSNNVRKVDLPNQLLPFTTFLVTTWLQLPRAVLALFLVFFSVVFFFLYLILLIFHWKAMSALILWKEKYIRAENNSVFFYFFFLINQRKQLPLKEVFEIGN